jgi:ribosomal subunit interface protein
MQIQIHKGKQVEVGEDFNEFVSDEIQTKLKRFEERITRVEAHFADENGSGKSSDDDKRCVLEARLTGMQPISVTAHASSVRFALEGAIDKMKTTLGRTLDKMSHTKGRTALGDIPEAEV